MNSILTLFIKDLLTSDDSEKQMFPIEHLDLFYKDEDMSKEVEKSYYIFLKDFCTRVSSKWKKFLKELSEDADRVIPDKKLTYSDEAYAWWFLKYQYDEQKTIAEEIKNTPGGLPEWTKANKKKIRSGPQYRKKYEMQYEMILDTITTTRDNQAKKEYLDNVFFELIFEEALSKAQPGTKVASISYAPIDVERLMEDS
jgi:hypothetical protein